MVWVIILILQLLSHIFTTMKLELSSLLLLIVLLSPNVVDGKSDDDTFILLSEYRYPIVCNILNKTVVFY